MSLSRRQMILGMSLAFGIGPLPAVGQGREPTVTTVAGTGTAGYSDDSEAPLGTETPINNPYGIVKGPDDALYFCEVDGGRTRRLDLQTGRLSTFAGTGVAGYTGDGELATNAGFSAPHELRFDQSGHLYIVERDAHVVRRIDRQTGRVSTIAGTGVAGFGGDGGPAANAQLRQPHSIAFSANGDLLVCDIGNQRIRRIDARTGFIDTLGGDGSRDPTPDEGRLSGTPLRGPRSIDTDLDGNAYLVLREGNAVFRLDLNGNRLIRIAGTGEKGYSGDGGPALACRFDGPKGIAYSAIDHCLYIVDTENHVIRRLHLDSGIITTVLGTGVAVDGPDGDPLRCGLARPHGVCMHDGVLYVTDSENHRIRAVTGLV